MKYITISILFLLLFSAVVSAQDTTIEMHPPEITVDSGQTFNVSLFVTANQVVNTVATDLITWDKNVLECLSVRQGGLFPDTVIWIQGTINNENGTIKSMVWGSQLTTNSSGTFAILTFKAKSGTTDIVIDPENYGVANDGIALNRSILNACTVTVIGGSIFPTNITVPPSFGYLIVFIILVIAISAVVILFWRKRKKPKPRKRGIPEKDDDIFG